MMYIPYTDDSNVEDYVTWVAYFVYDPNVGISINEWDSVEYAAHCYQ